MGPMLRGVGNVLKKIPWHLIIGAIGVGHPIYKDYKNVKLRQQSPPRDTRLDEIERKYTRLVESHERQNMDLTNTVNKLSSRLVFLTWVAALAIIFGVIMLVLYIIR
jgi:hypothetical protein